MKIITLTDGKNRCFGETQTNTAAGYKKDAQRIWPVFFAHDGEVRYKVSNTDGAPTPSGGEGKFRCF